MQTRYIHPNAILDIADQSYFADIEIELLYYQITATFCSPSMGLIRTSSPHEFASLRLTFPDEKSLVAFELSFDGPVTQDCPNEFDIVDRPPRNFAPISLEAAGIIRGHITELQAEARRDKINKTEEELSARSGRHEGD